MSRVENLGVKTSFDDLKTNHPELHAQICDYFFEQKIDLYSSDTKSVSHCLLVYDHYMFYLATLVTAHKQLENGEAGVYAVIIELYLGKLLPTSNDPLDFYLKFTVNCVYHILTFFLSHPPEIVNFEASKKLFFNRIILLYKYFEFSKKVQGGESYWLLSNLLPQLAQCYQKNTQWSGLFSELHDFATGKINGFSQDGEFMDYYRLFVKYSQQLVNQTRYKFLVNGEKEVHLFSRLKLVFMEMAER